MTLYGLNGLPITPQQAQPLLADAETRTVADTELTTTAGVLRIVTRHTLIDQAPEAQPGVTDVPEHIPVLYTTLVFDCPDQQRPRLAATYTNRPAAETGHGLVVVSVLTSCPDRVLTVHEVEYDLDYVSM